MATLHDMPAPDSGATVHLHTENEPDFGSFRLTGVEVRQIEEMGLTVEEAFRAAMAFWRAMPMEDCVARLKAMSDSRDSADEFPAGSA